MDAKRLAYLAGIQLKHGTIDVDVDGDVTIVAESITVAELEVNSKETEAVVEETNTTKIPKEVKSDLTAAVKSHLDAGNEMKAAGREQEAKFHFVTAEFLSELDTIMSGATEDDIKRASVKVHSARDSHMRQIPKSVYDFLVPDAFEQYRGKSLKDRFEDAQKERRGF